MHILFLTRCHSQVIIAFVLVFSHLGAIQLPKEQDRIALKEALLKTLEQSPEAVQEDLGVESSYEERVRSWRALSPRVDAKLSQTHYENTSGLFYPTPSRVGSISINQPIWDASSYYQIRASGARERGSLLLRDTSRYARAVALIASALECENLIALDGLLEEQKKQVLHDIDLYEKRTGMGLEERSTLLSLRSRLGLLERDIVHNELRYLELLHALLNFIGHQDCSRYLCIETDGKTLKEKVISFGLTKTRHITTHTRVLAEEEELQARQAERKKGAMLRLPTLSVLASAEVRDPAVETTPSWSVGCQLQFPLFTQGSNRSGYYQALIAEKWQKEQLRKVKQTTFLEKERAKMHLQYAQSAVESSLSVLEFSLEKYRIEKERVEIGAVSHRNYLDALVQLHQVEVEHASAQRQYISAILQVIDAQGASKEFIEELIAELD